MTEPNKITPVYLEYILWLTAAAAGAVDVISFVKLGGIFTSAMTGNLAFLGIYLARFSFYSALGSTIGLVGFIAGAAIGHGVTRGKGREISLNILLGIEICLLAGVMVLWFAAPHPNGSTMTDLLIALFAVSMGAQSIIGKKVNLSNIPTVVFTSTLTNMVIGITDALAEKKFVLPKDTKRQMTSFCLYFFGALIAGILAYLNLAILIFLPVAIIAAALWIKLTHKSAAF